MKIGAHVSAAGGILNAPQNAADLGCECFQFFSSSPRSGKRLEISQKEADNFINLSQKLGFEPNKDYIIHSPYFINLASKNNRIFYGSISSLRKELEIASKIKAPYVITHIGSGRDWQEHNVKEEINKTVLKALKKIHEGYKETALLVLEIAAGSGNIIGDNLEEIAHFIKSAQKEKFELGFCFDTCHGFAAGYDLRSAKAVEQVFQKIDRTVGLSNLKYIHFNDSVTELNSHRDRHEHIGKGKIGIEGLKAVIRKAQELNVNLILETKHEKIKKDLDLAKKIRNN